MSWELWLTKGEVKAHQTSKQELDNLRRLIARDLEDASVVALSADCRFATAYNARCRRPLFRLLAPAIA